MRRPAGRDFALGDDNAAVVANRLLSGSSNRPEDNIRQDIGRLMDILGHDNLLTYPTAAGPADIFLPRLRTLVETKRVGLAADPFKQQPRQGRETPHAQLDRYVRAEIESELDLLPLADPGDRDRPWLGVLTDGRVWHAWRYAHQPGPVGVPVFASFRPTGPSDLLERLGSLFADGPIGKPWIPTDPKPVFDGYLSDLEELRTSLSGRAEVETETKYRLWLDMLRTSSMAPASESRRRRLFVHHSFLIAIARGVIHTLAHPEAAPDPEVILRDNFSSWIVSVTAGREWARRLLERIHGLEWRRRRGDVLRLVYEEFIEAEDRKIFGEYYTPDWLAELIVDEVLDDDWCERSLLAALSVDSDPSALDGVGVLDPSCGSGTFLYHAAKRLLRSPALREQGLPPSRKAAAVASLVNGFDIHPIAVEIARATLLRALPAAPPDGPDEVRIHQGDSLMAGAGGADTLFGRDDAFLRYVTPKGSELHLTRAFAESRSFALKLRRLVSNAAHARPPPPDILAATPERERMMLNAFHESLKRVIREEGNSVWAWYFLNLAAPQLLSRRKVDRIVANPPWVRMSDIQVPARKRTLEEFARSQGLWDGGKQAANHDIAQLFVKRCRDLYLSDPVADPAAWIVKRTVMKGEHWRRFRKWYADFEAQIIDLDDLKPFGGGDARRCCILVDLRPFTRHVRIAANRVRGVRDGRSERASPGMNLEAALGRFDFAAAPAPIPQGKSEYLDGSGDPLFRCGGRIAPKVLLVVDRGVPRIDPARGSVTVTTARSDHRPWNAVAPLTVELPPSWIRPVFAADDLYPFGLCSEPTRAIIPTDRHGRLDADPAHGSWLELDRVYREHRGIGGNTPETLIARLDYGRAFSSQLPLPRDERKVVVLYPASADIMRAARSPVRTALFSDKLYGWTAPSEEEAAYLIAILNAPCLRSAFAESRRSGRDFHLYPWHRVPIPRFDPDNPAHDELAKLAVEAETAVMDFGTRSGGGQVSLSNGIRKRLADVGILAAMDAAIGRLLPDQVREI